MILKCITFSFGLLVWPQDTAQAAAPRRFERRLGMYWLVSPVDFVTSLIFLDRGKQSIYLKLLRYTPTTRALRFH